ncbi:uncharacterized protein H6S33_003437 [Morchella sextelata]|uniref:uncharacterized protein n=1 Tax=Morchella sextelata TaxID=1174677 RepID=UPI001D04E449|nr:uncharacterized protein H6S33_003437 [Morchella sextelata]KAH0606603.1 hypothetical protein H6S33_003437 [Morchella sextelata]
MSTPTATTTTTTTTPTTTSRPSTAGAIIKDLVTTTATEIVVVPPRPNSSCACTVPELDDLEESAPPTAPMLDTESSAKIVVPKPQPAGASTLDLVPRQPSPMVRAEEQELKDAYLAGFKHVEDFFAKFIESLNFYKRKSASLETEIAELKAAKEELEAKVKELEEQRDETDKQRAEREKLKEGKAINKMRKLIWSASVSHKRKSSTEGVVPVVASVEAK